MAAGAPFRRVAILGTGLIGGSFGLALRKQFPEIHAASWDRAAVLDEAKQRGAISEACKELPEALRSAELVYLALPVGAALHILPEVARLAEPGALVTDACSTKKTICQAAARYFEPGRALFLGGHPLAGKETSGIAAADADIFRGAQYALIAEGGASVRTDARAARFAALLEAIGARPVWLEAETHDWAVAIISHLPQLVSVALAGVVHDEMDETGLPVTLAGHGLRDVLRLAGSPYELWRDIALTNTENITRALDRVCQALEQLRTHLSSRELEKDFSTANELYKILRDLQ